MAVSIVGRAQPPPRAAAAACRICPVVRGSSTPAKRGETNAFGVSLPVYKTLPVDARGVLKGTGDPELDGEVDGAFDLTDRLAKSDKVRQSIIRHAFRYFMGRNETLSDSKTLIDADQAYINSGGSFDAVIVSLLTSDSFIYRKPVRTHDGDQ